ncbi:hypothetical protein [Photobacterium galatheae]|uniref:Membrane protein n=1 Tax=Photobacterium galatheae TaxID=1654360 RepID=A0A066RRR8_9GAMM|nr:hypothetical protein [Photobacterium galatheae]KDM91801.1 membrane protein [Photobacterium galatheae]MCM0147105.1 hypothetical protein [Photobacterium galatheae]
MNIAYTTFLIPALLGVQLILSLVLTKGEICPGQRGRIHKTLPVLLLGWVLVAVSQAAALLPLLTLAWFTFQVKTGKTRDAGPLWVLYVSCGLALLNWLLLLPSLSLPAIGMSLVAIALLGASFAHLLLTQARTRLQAFHRLLPAVGLVSAMLSVLLMLWQLYTLPQAVVESQLLVICAALLLLIVAQLVWVGHIVLAKTVHFWQLACASFLLSVSAGLQLAVF